MMANQSPSPDLPVHPPLTLQPPPSQQSLALECSICVEQYSQVFDHNPRSLRCGHTFCTKCLFRIMTTRGIKCPVCSKWHNMERPDVQQLPPNYAVMEIVKDYVEPVENQATKQPKCDACNEKTASVVCLDCSPGSQFVFCEGCDSSEHNRPFAPVRRHRRFPIDKPPPAHIICTVHRSNQATLYSVSLSQFACDECKLSQDWVTRGPQFEPLHEAVRRLRTQTQKLNQYSRDVIDRLTGSNRTLSTIIHDLGPSASTAKSQIQKTFGEVMDIIQERQQNLLKYVEDECVHRQHNLEKQLQKVQEATREFVDAHEDLNTLLPKSDVEFLLKYQVIVERIEKLLRDDDKSLYRPVAHQDIPFYVPKDIQHELHVLGAVGGGPTPTEIECQPSGEWGTLMRLDWQLPPKCGDVLNYQVEYEYLPNKQNVGWRGSGIVDSSYHDTEPHCIEIPGNVLKAYISYLCPGYTYRFRIRSSNAAGLGMWSNQVISSCEDFPFNLGYTKKIHRIRIPNNGYYRITASGAKAKDGQRCFGGRGAIISATFSFKAGEVLIILCGGMSELQYCNTGGGGGTFIAVNEINKDNLLIAAGGGGGTRGFDDRDENGCDASLEPSGTDGRGHEHGKGGIDGGPGEDANSSTFVGPCWGYGGAGFLQNASSARSFLSGGDAGQYGGFGGGGAVGVYGGGGGGGYSGGGGGRGGGGGGSYVREDGIDIVKKCGNEGHGSVLIKQVAPPYPSDEPCSDSQPNRVVSPPITAVVRVDTNFQQQVSHPSQLVGQTSQSSVVSENSGSRHSSLSGATGQYTGSTGISSSSELEPVSEVIGLELDDNLESTSDLSQRFVVSTSGDQFHAGTIPPSVDSEYPPSTTRSAVALPPEPVPSTVAPLIPATSQQPRMPADKPLYSQALRGTATNAEYVPPISEPHSQHPTAPGVTLHQPETIGIPIAIPTTATQPPFPGAPPHYVAQLSTARNLNPQMLSTDSQFQGAIPTTVPTTTQPSFTGAPPQYAAQLSTASSSSDLNSQVVSKPPDSQS